MAVIDVQVVRVAGVVERADLSGEGLSLEVRLAEAQDRWVERCTVDPSFAARPGDQLDLCYIRVEYRQGSTLGSIRNRRTGAEAVFDAPLREACEAQVLVDHRRRGCLFGGIGVVVAGGYLGTLLPWWATLLALPLGWIIGGLVALLLVPLRVRQSDVDAIKDLLRGHGGGRERV
ncbi:hypothetical protein [Chelatococcus reniformis]|uniref:Uncharacterized protein n=1 Tax=Chelatococcus reniformis TaxID=1494448 RepID=A0A916XCD2_9HYPH|nr:hypothetical protein [Chelatococcus reniformis]GGC60241.1 hypothetical protein GCM10010994_18620 [Chelatococcus reniformis]